MVEGGVEEAVRRDLDAIAERDAALAGSGLAIAALALATRIDDLGNSATSVAACARALVEALDRLRELVPAESEADALDDLGRARASRLAG